MTITRENFRNVRRSELQHAIQVGAPEADLARAELRRRRQRLRLIVGGTPLAIIAAVAAGIAIASVLRLLLR